MQGGVILLDLVRQLRTANIIKCLLLPQKEQKPVRTFELTLAPGAPGGGGFHSKVSNDHL